MQLASSHRFSENIFVPAIVIPELKFRDIKREIFSANLVERSDDSALEDRPEAFNRIGVDRADNVLPARVIDTPMRKFAVEFVVARPGIGAEQANFFGNGAAHESGKRLTVNAVDNPRHYIALAADRTRDNRFAGTNATSAATLTALVLVPILGETADEGFVNLNDPHELIEILIGQRRADAVAHIPSRAVRAEAHDALHLQSRNAFLAGQHRMDDAEPIAQWLIGVLENRAGDMRKAIICAGRRAFIAAPIPRQRTIGLNQSVAAARAIDTARPAVRHQIGRAMIFIREGFFPLSEGHLMNLLGLFRAGHIEHPFQQEPIWQS